MQSWGRAQGAFMAALFAQGLAWERMHALVRQYAAAMGSARHLLADLTLPLIAVFSGAGFDRVVRDTFSQGAQRIEDLWLRRAPRSLLSGLVGLTMPCKQGIPLRPSCLRATPFSYRRRHAGYNLACLECISVWAAALSLSLCWAARRRTPSPIPRALVLCQQSAHS